MSRALALALSLSLFGGQGEVDQARTDCARLENALLEYQSRHGRLPQELQTLVLDGLAPAIPFDPWNRAYVFNPLTQPRVRSVGKDGFPNTADDVTAETPVSSSGCF